MFNMEKAIAGWRQQMRSSGLKDSDALYELESHLRDEIQQQMQVGLRPQQAFEAALTCIGGAQALNTEFAKLRRAHVDFLARLKRLLLGGFLRSLAVPPLSAFTPNAQQTLELARAEAPRLNHDFIGTEHVLLGLLDSPSGTLANIMRRMGIDAETVRHEVAALIGPGLPAQRVAATIPFTPRAIRALSLAASEAEALKQAQVSPEHILLGLLKEGEGVAALVLRKLGVDINQLQEAISQGPENQ
jgi:Clp amino terminal domain, pathogenicity island component